ncbi:MAG: hypothetical protein IPN33_08555 [Saprospiraceae bacterium]|nr:hypothetical protein [Saprospiraceae bacterium]
MTSYIKLFGLLAVTVFLFSSCTKDEDFAGQEILGEYIGSTTIIDNRFLMTPFSWVADTSVVDPDRLIVFKADDGHIEVRLESRGNSSWTFVFDPSETGEYEFHHLYSAHPGLPSGIDLYINASEKYLKLYSYTRLSDHRDDYTCFEGWKK